MEKYNQLKENVQHFIGTISQVSSGVADNQYIRSGYRINYNTPILILKSLFHKHNELINVWTHVLGALIAFLLIIQIILYADGNKHRVTQDIEQIFTIEQNNNQEASGSDQEAYQFQELIDKLEIIENQVITSEHFQEIVHLIGNATELLRPEEELIEESAKIIKTKLLSIRNKIIEQVDSEEFDWLEIYKYSYSHTSILRQEQLYRKVDDPIHISRWPILVFLVSAIICMFGSAMFHLFYQMSSVANKYLLRVDYGGISILILGSTFPPYFYGFYCEHYLRNFYLFLLGSGCTAAYVISIFDFIHQEKWRKVKGIMYGSLGLFAGVPAVHLYIRQFYDIEDTDYLPFKHSFIYYVLMGSSYIGGLVIYTLRIPERFKPGKFDLIGSSHQIWHICVFMGVIFSYVGAIYNLADRRFTFCIL